MLGRMASTTSPRWPALPAGFGVLLRNARINAGLSRDALAAVTQSSKGLVQALEDAMRPPSATMAVRISEALQLDAWEAAVLQSAAVDDAALHSRRGVRHTRPRRRVNTSAQ